MLSLLYCLYLKFPENFEHEAFWDIGCCHSNLSFEFAEWETAFLISCDCYAKSKTLVFHYLADSLSGDM